ncbi:MAG: hypothetical protein ACFFCM_17185 [Promethearchaeota archaeon]
MKKQLPIKEITYDKLIKLQRILRANKTYRKFGKNMNEVIKFLLDYFTFAKLEKKQNNELENMYQELKLLDNDDKEMNIDIEIDNEIYDKALKLVYSIRASETHRKFARDLNHVIEFLLIFFFTDQTIKSGENNTFLV